MNSPARNKTRFPTANVHRFSLHGERHHAFHSIDGLVVMLVRMWQRHLRPNRDGEFEHRHGTIRVGGFEQKTDFDLPNLNSLTFHSRFTSLKRCSWSFTFTRNSPCSTCKTSSSAR